MREGDHNEKYTKYQFINDFFSLSPFLFIFQLFLGSFSI